MESSPYWATLWWTPGWSTAVGNTWTRWRIGIMYISFGFRNTMISWETTEWMNWTDAARPSNSPTKSYGFGSLWGPAGSWLTTRSRTLLNSRWTTSDKGRVTQMIWPRLDGRRTARLLKFQGGVLSVVLGVVMGYCIMSVHARPIGLGNLADDFCRSCKNEEEKGTILLLLGTCPALCQRRKRDLGGT